MRRASGVVSRARPARGDLFGFDDAYGRLDKRRRRRAGVVDASPRVLVGVIVGIVIVIRSLTTTTTTTTTSRRVDGNPSAPSAAFCARDDPIVCAHGGDVREGELANTRAPLTRASRLYDCVEIDVARTNDGALVAMHGRDVRRFTRGALSDVGEVSRDELEMWNADGAEALDFERALGAALERGRATLGQITIDFKENAPKGGRGLAEAVVTVGKTLGCEQCLYWGKSDETVREALRLGAKRVGFVVANFSAVLRAQRFDQLHGRVKGAHAVAVQSEMVTTDFVRKARKKRLAVHVWTVNDEDAMQRIVNFGVDGIVTDEPQLLKRTLERMRRQCPRGNDEV